MALLFADSSSDNVNFGSGSSLDNITAGTLIWWAKHTSVANALRLFFRHNGGTHGFDLYRRGADGTTWKFEWFRSTTIQIVETVTGTLVAGEWYCGAVQWDQTSGGPTAYKGNLTTSLVDVSTGATNGSGTHDDSAGNFYVGTNGTNCDAVTVACVAVFNRRLSLGEMRAWQFQPRVMSGCVLFSHLGFAGTGTQPDWSGNANSGTVTGATVANHAPLGPPFGFDLGWQGAFTAAAAGATASPSSGNIVFSGKIPTITGAVASTASPTAGTIVFTGKTPSVAGATDSTSAPATGTIVFTGQVPTTLIGIQVTADPPAGSIIFTGKIPTIVGAVASTASPSAGTIVFTGQAPSADVDSGARTASPSAGQIILTGFAPTVEVSGRIAVIPGGVRNRYRRRLRILPDGRITLADDREVQELLRFFKPEELRKVTKPKRKVSLKARAIPAPEIIAEMEEEADVLYVIQEALRRI